MTVCIIGEKGAEEKLGDLMKVTSWTKYLPISYNARATVLAEN
jgi:hypothetical protein